MLNHGINAINKKYEKFVRILMKVRTALPEMRL